MPPRPVPGPAPAPCGGLRRGNLKEGKNMETFKKLAKKGDHMERRPDRKWEIKNGICNKDGSFKTKEQREFERKKQLLVKWNWLALGIVS